MLHTILGRLGENFACSVLRKKGYRILARNFKTKLGEIDIVSMDGEDVVFTEVKTRNSTKFGYPQEAVNAKRIRRIANAGQIFIKKMGLKAMRERIEVFPILVKDGKVQYFEIINAFA